MQTEPHDDRRAARPSGWLRHRNLPADLTGVPPRRWLIGAVVAAVLSLVGGVLAAPTSVTIDGTKGGRTFDGIGAISGGGGNSRLLIDYPEPSRSEILDYLFKPRYGAALQILKVEVGGDTNSTSGAEPSHRHTPADLNCDRGYEWWLMEEAKARNPNIKLAALAWGAPGWIGNGNFWSTDMVNYLVSWLDCASDAHGLRIDYIGGWNERSYNKAWYQNLKLTLQGRGYNHVKVVADDTSFRVADAIVADPLFASAVDIIGSHYVCGYRTSQSNCPSSSNALASGKTLWASENGSDDHNAGAAALARGINRGYIDGRMTAYINWPLIAAVTPNIPFPTMGLAVAAQPWSGAYSIGRNAWVVAHTAQFSAPGWRYIDSASGYLGGNRTNGSYVTLRSSLTSNYSIVIETMDATIAQTFTAVVTGGLSLGTVHVWATDVRNTSGSTVFAHVANVTPAGGTFSVTLQPGFVYTLSTATGQAKGSATSPPAGPLSLPYTDSFDGYAVGRQARYLSDMQGAFEVTGCGGGRGGLCVRQMTAQAPIAWNPLTDPYALLGDVGWANYKVSSDVLLQQPGYVQVIGRATGQRPFVPSALDAYYLRVWNTGAWSLLRNESTNVATTLRSGTVAPLGTSWHNLALTFSGMAITAQIDGATIATLTDARWSAGQVGFGTRQGATAQFDNLRITAVTGPPPPSSAPLVGVGSGRCLDVPGQRQTNGTPLVIWDCNGGSNQQWTQLSNGAIQVYGTKCMDVLGHNTAPGATVAIWDCTGGANQQWRVNADGTIVGVESGLCLDVTGARTGNGTPVEIWTCNGGSNQKWRR
jgi:O-glycosyl hydrolase